MKKTLASLYRDNRAALWIIAAFTAVRLAVAPTFGLGTDEAHYVLYAKHLALSYFDHPPLVGWTHALFYTRWARTNSWRGFQPSFSLSSHRSYAIGSPYRSAEEGPRSMRLLP